MEWLLGLAFLPVLLCGSMCVGGMALAAVSRRRTTARRTCCDGPTGADTREPQSLPADL